MATEETNITKRVMKAVSKVGTRLFRQNTGLAWQGDIIARTRDTITLGKPRPIHCGLIKGSSDLIGWHPVKVTPEMVGKTLAVFTAFEAKTKDGRPTPEQENFVNVIKQTGGIAGIVRSEQEALELLP